MPNLPVSGVEALDKCAEACERKGKFSEDTNFRAMNAHDPAFSAFDGIFLGSLRRYNHG